VVFSDELSEGPPAALVSGGFPSLRQIPSLEFTDAAIGQVRINAEDRSDDFRGQLQQVL
jgi:hypothetical protein